MLAPQGISRNLRELYIRDGITIGDIQITPDSNALSIQGNISAQNATLQDVNLNNAFIQALDAQTITAANFTADNITINNNATISSVNAQTISSASANIDNLTINNNATISNIDTQSMDALSANIDNLTVSNSATVSNLTANALTVNADIIQILNDVTLRKVATDTWDYNNKASSAGKIKFTYSVAGTESAFHAINPAIKAFVMRVSDATHGLWFQVGRNTRMSIWNDNIFCNGVDLNITDPNKGIVLKDRANGQRYRIYINNGNLQLEAL
jgi:hypothetical protein